MTYATEEERIAARRNAWAKYNQAHRIERAAHNKEHVQKEYVKARRRERYAERVVIRSLSMVRQNSTPNHRNHGGSDDTTALSYHGQEGESQ